MTYLCCARPGHTPRTVVLCTHRPHQYRRGHVALEPDSMDCWMGRLWAASLNHLPGCKLSPGTCSQSTRTARLGVVAVPHRPRSRQSSRRPHHQKASTLVPGMQQRVSLRFGWPKKPMQRTETWFRSSLSASASRPTKWCGLSRRRNPFCATGMFEG